MGDAPGWLRSPRKLAQPQRYTTTLLIRPGQAIRWSRFLSGGSASHAHAYCNLFGRFPPRIFGIRSDNGPKSGDPSSGLDSLLETGLRTRKSLNCRFVAGCLKIRMVVDCVSVRADRGEARGAIFFRADQLVLKSTFVQIGRLAFHLQVSRIAAVTMPATVRYVKLLRFASWQPSMKTLKR